MDRNEKRRYERLGEKFELSCRRIGSRTGQTFQGFTENISPGGAYFRTKADTLKRGDLLKIELAIPPKSGMLEFGGKMEGFAKVLRMDNIWDFSADEATSEGIHGVALQFCHPPKLCI